MHFSHDLYQIDDEEFEACFKIVMRNLSPECWCDLIPEAQNQMLNEVDAFLQHDLLSSKQRFPLLIESLKKLESIITLEQKIRIEKILEKHRGQKRGHEISNFFC
jgi:hypothetical protein